jgi:hypothetical protein
MTIRGSTVRWLATVLIAVATLGMSGTAAANGHFSSGGGGGGGGGGGSHGGGFGGGGHVSAHVGHAPSFSGPRGAFHAPTGAYRGPSVGWRGPSQVSRGWSGGSAPSRAITPTRALTASHGHAPWGRTGTGGYGYYGRGYYGYHPYYSFVGWLPPYYSTFWWGGIPYYFADNTYFLWDANVGQYQVVPPPPGADESTDAAATGEPYVYPSAGQSAEQQSTDRYECHRWATDQTGFDPTQTNGGVSPEAAGSASEAYRRAEAACLTGRGYTVQ